MVFQNVETRNYSDRIETMYLGQPEFLVTVLSKAGSTYTAKRGKRLNRIGLGCVSGGEARANWF